MIKFRPHRGGLAESMAQQVVIHVIEDLIFKISKDMCMRCVGVEAKYEGMDPRTDWDTYLVIAEFEGKSGNKKYPVGYSDGDFSTLFP